jgi:hypothetical protein
MRRWQAGLLCCRSQRTLTGLGSAESDVPIQVSARSVGHGSTIYTMSVYNLRQSMRVTLACLGAVLVWGVLPPAASAQTVATIEPTFAPDRPGAQTSVTFAARLSNDAGGIPAALSKVVILLPAGFAETLQWPRSSGCSSAHLRAHGARGCPPRSQVGAGTALLAWQEGARTGYERARLGLFTGPTDGVPRLELLAEGMTPIRRRVVINVLLSLISAPYSAEMETIIPPIPTLPGQADASLVSFSVTVGPLSKALVSQRPSPWGELELFAPRRCPVGGYPWTVEFTYEGGATQEVDAAIPCR